MRSYEEVKREENYVLTAVARNFTSVREPDAKLNKSTKYERCTRREDKSNNCRNEHAPRYIIS